MSFFRMPAASLIGIIMAGCSPQCNIGGAYFPAWLACGLGAFAGTWLALRLLSPLFYGSKC
jgi:hypothetical protein